MDVSNRRAKGAGPATPTAVAPQVENQTGFETNEAPPGRQAIPSRSPSFWQPRRIPIGEAITVDSRSVPCSRESV